MSNTNKLNLWEKLLKVKEALGKFTKDKTSGAGNSAYEYVSGNQILEIINPLLIENKIVLKSEVLSIESRDITYQVKDYNSGGFRDKSGILFEIPMRMTWINAENPTEREEVLWGGTGENNLEKGYGSALTYAERYFLLKFFNIETDGDDPDHASNPQKTSGRSRQPQSSSKGSGQRVTTTKVKLPQPSGEATKKPPTPGQWENLKNRFALKEISWDQIDHYFQLSDDQVAELMEVQNG